MQVLFYNKYGNMIFKYTTLATNQTSTEDLGQLQPGVHNSSLNQYNLSQRQDTIHNKHLYT